MNRKPVFWKTWAAVVVVLVLSAFVLAACSSPSASSNAPKPSNPGGAGDAVNLTGDATAGATVFTTNCVACHGDQGKGGIPNPGSDNNTVPALNPVNPALKDADAKAFATNLDLFIEHGSTPKGSAPALQMKAWGDQKTLTSQQIADVIAYIISLNK